MLSIRPHVAKRRFPEEQKMRLPGDLYINETIIILYPAWSVFPHDYLLRTKKPFDPAHHNQAAA